MSWLFNDMTVTVKLEHMQCGECGIHFAMDSAKYDRCKELGEGWTCPNGHSRVFTKSKTKELQEKIDSLSRQNEYLSKAKESLHERLTSANHRASSYKGQATKIRKRIQNGVCPCCNRTFQDLARHMASKHPDKTVTN